MRTSLMVIMFALQAVAQTNKDFVQKQFFPATVLLYSGDEKGGMDMRCTATAIEKDKDSYVFVSAAHCACADDADKKTVSPEKKDFYVTADTVGEKVYIPAKVTACGYRHRGDDFALLKAETKSEFTTVPLGDDPETMDEIINVGGPLGLGKLVLTGSVSSAKLDRPIHDDDIDWQGAVALQEFGVNGGSSGSAVVCMSQHKICAFVVGSIGQTTMTAMPVSRLKAMQKAYADKTYTWWVSDPDQAPKPH